MFIFEQKTLFTSNHHYSKFSILGLFSIEPRLPRGVYSSNIRPKCWGIIFQLWGRISSFWEKKKEKKIQSNNIDK